MPSILSSPCGSFGTLLPFGLIARSKPSIGILRQLEVIVCKVRESFRGGRMKWQAAGFCTVDLEALSFVSTGSNSRNSNRKTTA